MARPCLMVSLVLLLAGVGQAQQIFFENFDSGIPGNWIKINRSDPMGYGTDFVSPWHASVAPDDTTSKGVPLSPGGGKFACARDSSDATSQLSAGTIDNWLLTPVLQLKQGDQVFFWSYTRGGGGQDSLEVRLSSGSGYDIGTWNQSVADNPIYSDPAFPAFVTAGVNNVGTFTTRIGVINDWLRPDPGNTPANPIEPGKVWLQHTYTVPADMTGRIAIRYLSFDAGYGGNLDGNLDGIDSFTVTRPESMPVPEPATLSLLALSSLAILARKRALKA